MRGIIDQSSQAENNMPLVKTSHRAINLDHLSLQTDGNRQLESEVLSLFSKQANQAQLRLPIASHDERKLMAHTIKGSALAIGAERVAEYAGGLETRPDDAQVMEELLDALVETQEFIAAICR